MNIDRIHPLKQSQVARIVERAREDKRVRFLVVFGSSADFRCNSYSDIDIYAETDGYTTIDKSDIESEADVVYNLDHNNRLFTEIERTGVVVYKRSDVHLDVNGAE